MGETIRGMIAIGVWKLCVVVIAACGFHRGAAPSDVAPSDVAAGDTGTVPGIQHVQNAMAIGAGTTITVTLAQPVGAGDLLVGSFRGAGTPTVADNVNGAWTQIDGAALMFLFYLGNSRSAGAGELVVTLTADTGNLRVSVDDFAGVATTTALDQHTLGYSAAPNTTWAAPPTPGVPAGELVYVGGGCATDSIAFTAGATNGVPMVLSAQVENGANGSSFTEYALAAAAGPQDATATAAPNNGITGILATFRAP